MLLEETIERLIERDAGGGTATDRNHLTCSVISEQETEGGAVFPQQFLPGPRTIGWGHRPLHRYGDIPS